MPVGGELGKSAFMTSCVVMLSAVRGEGQSGVRVAVVDDAVGTSLFVLVGGESGKSVFMMFCVGMLSKVKGEGSSGV